LQRLNESAQFEQNDCQAAVMRKGTASRGPYHDPSFRLTLCSYPLSAAFW